MSDLIDMLFTGIGKAFDFLQKIQVFGVSLLSYIIAVFIIGLLITAVFNVVKQPRITQTREKKVKNK